jgi:hypothetical protein
MIYMTFCSQKKITVPGIEGISPVIAALAASAARAWSVLGLNARPLAVKHESGLNAIEKSTCNEHTAVCCIHFSADGLQCQNQRLPASATHLMSQRLAVCIASGCYLTWAAVFWGLRVVRVWQNGECPRSFEPLPRHK